MALTVINAGVRVNTIEVAAPDGAGNFRITAQYVMRDRFKTQPGAQNVSTPAPDTESAVNLLIAAINDDYADYTA